MLNGFSGGGDFPQYVLRQTTPSPMKKRGIGRSAKEGGMLLSRVVVAKKNDIRESAANVLLLNMAF